MCRYERCSERFSTDYFFAFVMKISSSKLRNKHQPACLTYATTGLGLKRERDRHLFISVRALKKSMEANQESYYSGLSISFPHPLSIWHALDAAFHLGMNRGLWMVLTDRAMRLPNHFKWESRRELLINTATRSPGGKNGESEWVWVPKACIFRHPFFYLILVSRPVSLTCSLRKFVLIPDRWAYYSFRRQAMKMG